jgi:phosphoglycolate phosphatase
MTLVRPACVLYDLDGTLVDSLPDIAAAVDDVLYSLRLPGAGRERVANWVGRGVTALVTDALRYGLDAEPTPEQIQRARRGFHGAYGLNYCRDTVPYPGTIDCLRAVAALGIKQAIVTNKPEEFARLIAEKLEMIDYFPVIVGGD